MITEPVQSYLGDGAYAKTTGLYGEIEVFTSDGVRATNHIFLGDAEIAELLRFIHKSHPDLFELVYHQTHGGLPCKG